MAITVNLKGGYLLAIPPKERGVANEFLSDLIAFVRSRSAQDI